MRLVRDQSVRRRYFEWLYGQVFDVKDPGSPLSYLTVCDLMHSIPFNDSVPNDSNRTAAGEELRQEYIALLDDIDVGEFTELAGLGKASLFEVLIGLARTAFDSTELLSTGEWFCKFLENLGLMRFPDSIVQPRDTLRINRAMRVMNARTYDPDGKGGIFPLKNPATDQRTIELWFQMSAYMTENGLY